MPQEPHLVALQLRVKETPEVQQFQAVTPDGQQAVEAVRVLLALLVAVGIQVIHLPLAHLEAPVYRQHLLVNL
jgi:hypothetical protein